MASIDMVDLEISEQRTVDKVSLRAVNALIKEVEVIEIDCNGGAPVERFESKMDEFQRYKRDLNKTLILLKADIKTKTQIEHRCGTNAETIKLKSAIKKRIDAAIMIQELMEGAYNENKEDLEKDRDCALSADEVQTRSELTTLMKQDLLFTRCLFENNGIMTDNPGDDVEEGGGIGFNKAKEARLRRKELRDNGAISVEPIQLTAKQQAFIQESIERDTLLDEKLDVIKRGVINLGNIAYDINNEIAVQDVMLDEVNKKMGDVTEKLERRNDDIKKLLDKSGGAARWCPVLVLCVILMAAIGYIYNATTGNKK